MNITRSLSRLARRKQYKEVTAQIEKWSGRRDSCKAQKLDMLGVTGANMEPLDRGIAHAARMVQFWTRRLQELLDERRTDQARD